MVRQESILRQQLGNFVYVVNAKNRIERRKIEIGMDQLMKDRTTFVIAHRLSTVRNANAIMVLEHGVIIERGDHDQLLEMKGRYYELYTGKKELD